MEELRALFSGFVQTAKRVAANADNEEARLIAAHAGDVISFGIDNAEATLGVAAETIEDTASGIRAVLIDRRDDTIHPLALAMPGRHNLSNALAAVAGAVAAGVSVHDACVALTTFKGLARRFDVIGTSPGGVTVIDDFGHNSEKCRATLRTLKAHPGRVIAFFQPHGYGPLRQMGHELARTFADELGPDDLTLMCDPVYFGGTVDRSEGSERIVALIKEHGGSAEYIPTREACGERIQALARPGDRIVVMGARDDTLSQFAGELLAHLA
jgi:UDP-N-acetylmuramate--alanine ligase